MEHDEDLESPQEEVSGTGVTGHLGEVRAVGGSTRIGSLSMRVMLFWSVRFRHWKMD